MLCLIMNGPSPVQWLRQACLCVVDGRLPLQLLMSAAWLPQDGDGKVLNLVLQGATASFGANIGCQESTTEMEAVCNITGADPY